MGDGECGPPLLGVGGRTPTLYVHQVRNFAWSPSLFRPKLRHCMDSALHYSRHITTFTVYVTACDLMKSFRFNHVAAGSLQPVTVVLRTVSVQTTSV